MKLYELSEAYQRLLDGECFDEETGEIIEPSEAELDDIKDEIGVKAVNLGKVIKTLEGWAKNAKEEKMRLDKLKSSYEKKAEVLANYLFENLKTTGIEKIEDPVLPVKLVKKAPYLSVYDESKIDADYFVPQPAKLDKRKLLDDLKNGVVVEGAGFGQETKRLKIG